MHGSTCLCPRCQAARESAFESESFAHETGGFAGELGSPLSEAEEVELAMELMAVSSEAEMDQFLGKIWKGIKKVGSVVGKVAKPFAGALKAVAKKALPFVGGALGSFIPIPGVGTAIGSALGGALSKALEMEYGELDREEAELEMAKRFVRIAASAAQQAAGAPPTANPNAVVNQALVAAARRHLPNADLGALGRAAPGAGAHTGRWIRQGANIVVVGA